MHPPPAGVLLSSPLTFTFTVASPDKAGRARICPRALKYRYRSLHGSARLCTVSVFRAVQGPFKQFLEGFSALAKKSAKSPCPRGESFSRVHSENLLLSPSCLRALNALVSHVCPMKSNKDARGEESIDPNKLPISNKIFRGSFSYFSERASFSLDRSQLTSCCLVQWPSHKHSR